MEKALLKKIDDELVEQKAQLDYYQGRILRTEGAIQALQDLKTHIELEIAAPVVTEDSAGAF